MRRNRISSHRYVLPLKMFGNGIVRSYLPNSEIRYFSFNYFLLAGLLLLSPVSAKPQRIISLDTATDTLVLQLADLDNIVAVRERSKKPDNSTQAEKASKLIGLKREMAEEVYRLNPDLVFFGQWSGRATRELLQKLNVPVCRLKSPKKWEDVFDNIRNTGELLGEKQRAQAMIDEIQTRLAIVESKLKNTKPLRAVYFLGRGSTYGSGTKADFMMKSAGLINISAESGIKGLGKISVEELILNKPDVVIFSNYHKHTPTLSRQILDHPALAKFSKNIIQLDMPSNKVNCTDASLVECVEVLARIAHPQAFKSTTASINH